MFYADTKYFILLSFSKVSYYGVFVLDFRYTEVVPPSSAKTLKTIVIICAFIYNLTGTIIASEKKHQCQHI